MQNKYQYEIKQKTLLNGKVTFEGVVFTVNNLWPALTTYSRTFYGDSLEEVKDKIKQYVNVFVERDKIVEFGDAKDLL